MPKDIFTPREELICGKLDMLADAIRAGDLLLALAYVEECRYDATRMEQKLIERKQEVEALKKLKPCNFNWKNNTDKEWGFIAHELQSVVPECVKGKKDEKKKDGTPKYQQVDTNKLIPLLVGAIKDLSLEVSKLQTRIVALESK